MGRKKLKFKTKHRCPKSSWGGFIEGRLFDYDYTKWMGWLPEEYKLYLDMKEIEELGKKEDIDEFSLELAKSIRNKEEIDFPVAVNFTEDEFKNFRRMVLMDKMLNCQK